MTNNQIALSISLKPIKVDMVVDADKTVVDELTEMYKNTPNEDWGGGIGVRKYFEDMWEGLQDGLDYFVANPEDVTGASQGWLEFCNDCVRCAVLYSVMTHEPLELIDKTMKREWLENFSAKLKQGVSQELLHASI